MLKLEVKMKPAFISLKAIRLTLIAFLFTLVAFCLLPVTVLAGSGLVSSVGGVTFPQGAKQFWFTSPRPTLSGITTAGATVTGTVGTESISATANSSGNWSWTPAADLSGDSTVTVTDGTQSASFTLTIGELPANIASASASALAPAGSINPTFIILGFGTLLTAFGLFKLRRTLP